MVNVMQPRGADYKVQRRVAGHHNYRLAGLTDLLTMASGASVFDVGCNRGLAGYDFALNGATKVHGCDIFEEGVATAREIFADLRAVDARFEVCDLTGGPAALKAFVPGNYDITLCLATYHKLKRVMSKDDLRGLVQYLGKWTTSYFAWRGTSEKHDENDAEIARLDKDLGEVGLLRIHTSYISRELGAAAIWARG
jgi:SAM-dependent methyltransferase